jgi:hypothetical protein
MKPMGPGEKLVMYVGVALILCMGGLIGYVATHYEQLRQDLIHREMQYLNSRE